VKDGSAERVRQGERGTCTIWFSHIHAFQEIVQDHPPEAVFHMLGEYISGIDRCLRGFGGEVDKFIDDGIMAVFPGPRRDLDAARASWAIVDFLERFNRGRRENGVFPISVGIGINSGPVIVGNLGSSRRKDLTVLGDPVNLAARLEGTSRAGKFTRIMVSGTVAEAIAGSFRCEDSGITSVKGKAEEIRILEIREVIS
jgi:class 3 adenylate cyclase